LILFGCYFYFIMADHFLFVLFITSLIFLKANLENFRFNFDFRNRSFLPIYLFLRRSVLFFANYLFFLLLKLLNLLALICQFFHQFFLFFYLYYLYYLLIIKLVVELELTKLFLIRDSYKLMQFFLSQLLSILLLFKPNLLTQELTFSFSSFYVLLFSFISFLLLVNPLDHYQLFHLKNAH
jgi:hypothetical protein